jgi:hypothetical protein
MVLAVGKEVLFGRMREGKMPEVMK